MLEQYRLGELNPEDKEAVTGAMTRDSDIVSRLNDLEESDRELRLRYPADFSDSGFTGLKNPKKRRRFHTPRFYRIAALVLVCILLPVVYFLRGNPGRLAETGNGDRIKGVFTSGSKLELYLKENPEKLLLDKAKLLEGNTVQLAYTAPAGKDYYGVIFSVDGRGMVTMHFPYNRTQSSLLVSGKRTFLNEAYTLDDAPDYEIFVMLISKEPLNAEAVLKEAGEFVKNLPAHEIGLIEEKSRAVFNDCEVETISVIKM